VHYKEHYEEQVLFGRQQGAGPEHGDSCPCHPAGAAHEACTVHHATTKYARSSEEIMTEFNVANEFVKFEVTN
jgi:hypothetical protein